MSDAAASLNFALSKAKLSSPLLSSLSRAEVAELAALATMREVVAGEEVIHQGEEADWVGVVLTGALKAAIPHSERYARRPHAAAEAAVTALQEWRMMACGAAVGEMALFSGLRRTARVEAITDGSIAVITFADLTERCSAALSAKVRTELATIGMERLAGNMDTGASARDAEKQQQQEEQLQQQQ